MRVIGKGITSCVVTPPVSCKDGETHKKGEIGKITSVNKAIKESKIQKILTHIDSNHLFTPERTEYCETQNSKQNLLYLLKRQGCDSLKNTRKPISQVIMKDHGDTFYSFISSNPRDTLKRLRDTTPLSYLGTEVVRLLFGGATLKKHNLYHTDLHINNILIDPETLDFCMIDFGELSTNKSVYKNIINKDYSQKDYQQIPIEMIFYEYIINNEKLISSLIKMPKHIENLLEKGKNTGRMSYDLVKTMNEIPSFRGIVNPFDESRFPENARKNLYSLRCKCLLSIIKLLRRKISLNYIIAKTLSTLDSVSIGIILQHFCYYMSKVEPTITSTELFNSINTNASKMCNADITKRISCLESLRNIFKHYKNIHKNDRRQEDRKIDLIKRVLKLI